MRRPLLLLLHIASIVSVLAAPAYAEDAAAGTVQMGHLPAWVQTVASSVPVYSTDAGTTVTARLARYAFLGVLGGGAWRLQIDAYDESGNLTGIRGWVDPDDVLPTAPASDWLVSSYATTLWRAPDSAAEAARAVDAFTPLQLLDGPVQSRIQVRVYGFDFTVLEQGWIDQAATGPALPPQTRVPSPTGERVARGASAANSQQAFFDTTVPAARDAARQTGVPASVTVAQAILESDWGRSLLAQNANNYFGIKAIGSLGSDGLVWMPTSEYDPDGQLYQTISAFRAYKSLTDSMTDHDRLLATSSRYATAMQASKDPRQFATFLSAAGYSTDPAYADKLISLMDGYNLYQLDA